MTITAIVRSTQGVRLAEREQGAADPPWVRVLRAGVCGTDLDIVRGARQDQATILGHEAVGILEPATDTERLVVFNPVDPTNQDRILGHDRDGVFRSFYPIATPSDRRHLVPIPGSLDVDLCVLCEPIAAALYGWELLASAQLEPRRITIFGAGTMGLIHAKLGLSRCVDVRLVHPDAQRLAWVHDTLFGDDVQYNVLSQRRIAPGDVAFMCTNRAGFVSALDAATATLTPGGAVVLVGGVPRGFRSELLPGIDLSAVRRANVSGRTLDGGGVTLAATSEGKRIVVTGHRGTSPAQIELAHSLLAKERAFFRSLITHVVEPEDAVGLINARCLGRQRDALGVEIVKIVIRFG